MKPVVEEGNHKGLPLQGLETIRDFFGLDGVCNPVRNAEKLESKASALGILAKTFILRLSKNV